MNFMVQNTCSLASKKIIMKYLKLNMLNQELNVQPKNDIIKKKWFDNSYNM
jgi:hypothetical protein